MTRESRTVPRMPNELLGRLRRSNVQVEAPDENTTLLHEVPTNCRYFTKPATNLLIRRPRPGLPFLVCVDDDLGYTGEDQALARAFAGGHSQQGWRVLYPAGGRGEDLSAVIEQALTLLGAESEEPRPPAAASAAGRADPGGLLAAFGDPLTSWVAEGRAETTLARGEELQEVLACLGQWKRRLPVVAGPSGSGKTNLLHGLTRELVRLRPGDRLVAVDLGALFAGTLFDSEREELLKRLQDEAAGEGVVLALERLELALVEAPHGRMLLEQAIEHGRRIVGTTRAPLGPELGESFHPVALVELGRAATTRILEELGPRVEAHHRVAIRAALRDLIAERASALPGALPGKAVALLDGAAARAALMGDPEVSEMHVYLASAGKARVRPPDAG